VRTQASGSSSAVGGRPLVCADALLHGQGRLLWPRRRLIRTLRPGADNSWRHWALVPSSGDRACAWRSLWVGVVELPPGCQNVGRSTASAVDGPDPATAATKARRPVVWCVATPGRAASPYCCGPAARGRAFDHRNRMRGWYTPGHENGASPSAGYPADPIPHQVGAPYLSPSACGPAQRA
jgi:hypothetical protein